MENDPIKALEKLLEIERTALVEGNLEALDRLTSRKEDLIGAINGLEVFDTRDLIRVQGKIERNQTLLNSAAEGIRAVADRMSELRRVRQEFSTYNASGQRNEFAVSARKTLEKRA